MTARRRLLFYGEIVTTRGRSHRVHCEDTLQQFLAGNRRKCSSQDSSRNSCTYLPAPAGSIEGSMADLDRGPALETSSYTAKLRACAHAGSSVRTATLSFGITIMQTVPYLTNG